MFTMWAALPAPLILSADLRPGASCGGIDDPEIMAILTNKEVIAVNQDFAAKPMLPITRVGGLEVWKKPLGYKGEAAVVLFNRNATGGPGSGVAAKAPVAPGTPLTSVPCGQAGAFAVTAASSGQGGPMTLRGNASLCVGQIGIARCANPPSPRLGVLLCNAADKSQAWRWDATTGHIINTKSSPPADINAGPTCPGDASASMLLYGVHGQVNEVWKYDSATGQIGQCVL